MNRIQETQVVKGSIARTWAAISKLGVVEDWHPNVASAVVLTPNDTGVGASRRVEFLSGDSVVETVVEESEREYSTMEMTESPMIKEAFVTISMKERSADTTAVTFSIDYSVKYGPVGWLISAVMMKRMFAKVFGVALAGLSHYLETGEVVTNNVSDPAD